jgi:hypothetical protein
MRPPPRNHCIVDFVYVYILYASCQDRSILWVQSRSLSFAAAQKNDGGTGKSSELCGHLPNCALQASSNCLRSKELITSRMTESIRNGEPSEIEGGFNAWPVLLRASG